MDGIPVIQGCRTVIGCKKVQEVPAGDHTIFIGEVVSSKFDEANKEQVLNRELYFGWESTNTVSIDGAAWRRRPNLHDPLSSVR